MTSCEINYLKVLCEIIMKKDQELFKDIREIIWSAVPDKAILAEEMMQVISQRLIEWEINIESFENITMPENALTSMYYLIETIQSEEFNNHIQIKYIQDVLSRDIQDFDKLHDCLERIPELLVELENRVIFYNINIERRINVYKSLTEFASNLFKILSDINVQLSNFQHDGIHQLKDMLTQHMKTLLKWSFVITNYPSRTIKKGSDKQTGTYFKATINCLIESEKLFSGVQVEPYFLTECDFKNYIHTKELKKDCMMKFNMKNCKQNIWESKRILWTPPTIQKDCQRSERVTEIKAIILFVFKATANPFLFKQFDISTCLYSDTVISIIHTNQEINALMTLFWDDYFRVDRSAFLEDGSFRCKDSVTIQECVDAISLYFKKETSRELTLANKEFLQRKLFRNAPNQMISWQMFSGQSMPESSISFGNWIMSIIKMLKIPGISELWQNNLIDGFMKKDVETQFINHQIGTFALRFSEKFVKIGVVVKSSNAMEAWDPFDADECRRRNLCERLMEYSELNRIMTATGQVQMKDEVLAKFIASRSPAIGYTKRGQWPRIDLSNIYSELANVYYNDNGETMNTDPFLGCDMDGSDFFS